MSEALPTQPLPSWPSGFPRFIPRRWLSNPHLQTIVGNFLPRKNTLPRPVPELIEVTPAHNRQIATQILCECHWQPASVRARRTTVILLHGLEGSSNSQYVIGNANKLWAAGCNVVRMNMRNCGGTEKLTPTLYHSGLSGDVDAVLRHCIEVHGSQSVALIGYSMGGNLVLKLTGELGTDAPPQLRCVVGVSPAVDLAASADALHEPQNRLYEQKFLRALLKRFRRKSMLFPRAYDPQMAAAIGSLRDFDDRITALYSGFKSADDYYYRAAAARVLDHIAVPTLLIHAADDPFIRFPTEARADIAANPHITWLETEHGGHCAFLATSTPINDGYWAEHIALRFILDHT
ncbi:YheT family hydrolase [Granulicella paludicola]|uniref:YheT family hydrolase n=1 Tax=Granulicella paludicola TaxID=474951 RepID=UPI0021DF4F31|nr:alpha/beta fold hydrolase [Granulicella paludicola]